MLRSGPPVSVSSGEVKVDFSAQAAESRKGRWVGLNIVFSASKKAYMQEYGNMPVGYLYTTWEQVKEYFPTVRKNVGTARHIA